MSTVNDPRRFMHKATDAQSNLAAAMSEEIKAVICSYEKRVPLALALGVLGIVHRELLDDHQ